MTEEQQVEAALDAAEQTRSKPFWRSKKFLLGIFVIVSWTWLIDRMLVLDVGAQKGATGVEMPREIWWAMMIKGALEALAIGGIAALDAYATKLPFGALVDSVTQPGTES